MIIGSVFTIAGGLCLFMAALTQPTAARSALFWPMMFHLLNSIGFAHILPISLALFSKIAPRQINATVIGLYYLAFFIANAVVGYVGGLYSSLPTTTFWLIHVASAVVRPCRLRRLQDRVWEADDGGTAGAGCGVVLSVTDDLAHESKFQWLAQASVSSCGVCSTSSSPRW